MVKRSSLYFFWQYSEHAAKFELPTKPPTFLGGPNFLFDFSIDDNTMKDFLRLGLCLYGQLPQFYYYVKNNFLFSPPSFRLLHAATTTTSTFFSSSDKTLRKVLYFLLMVVGPFFFSITYFFHGVLFFFLALLSFCLNSLCLTAIFLNWPDLCWDI